MKKLTFLIGLLVFTASGQARQAIDVALAKQYFDEAAQVAQADNGTLWGVSLAGPVLFDDPQSRAIVANRADAHGTLEAKEMRPSLTSSLPA